MELSDRAFALSCGIPQNVMFYYLNRQRKPSYEAIEKILNTYPELSAEWLTRGIGPMIPEPSTDIDKERFHILLNRISELQYEIELNNGLIK